MEAGDGVAGCKADEEPGGADECRVGPQGLRGQVGEVEPAKLHHTNNLMNGHVMNPVWQSYGWAREGRPERHETSHGGRARESRPVRAPVMTTQASCSL